VKTESSAATRKHLRGLLISAGIGIVTSGFYGIAASNRTGVAGFARTVLVGALIGASIYALINLLGYPIEQLMRRLNAGAKSQMIAHVLVSMIGGVAGGVAGLTLGARLLGATITISDLITERQGHTFIAMMAVVSVLAGFAFRGFELLQQSLHSTVERLKESEWAEKEIEMARSIQTRLLPPPRIDGERYVITARNLPARLVAGDFYDVVSLDDGSVAIIAADVAGKGMGASLIMASVKAVLPFVARNRVTEAMSMLNEKLVNELARREFVALAFARYFPADGSMHLANAGFPDPYLVRGNSVQPLVVGGVRLPLGIRKDVTYETTVTRLQPRDRVLFVSDGLPEAPTRSDQPLGYERLMQLIAQPWSSNGEWLDAFLGRVRAEVQETLADDWTAVALEIRS